MTRKIKNAKRAAHRTKYEAAIVGGGPAGLTLGCLLAKAGVSVACIDRPAPEALNLRTTAISYGSRQVLEEAGIWKRVAANACPIDRIEVLDGDSPVLLGFLKEEMDGKTFGWIVLNSDLRAAMLETFKAHKSARYIAPAGAKDFEVGDEGARVILDNGDALETNLVVGADGRNSFTREWMGVRTRAWNYRQRAILCAISHEHPHENIAIEHFRPEGPFAVLPMADDEKGRHRSAIVLTEHGPESRSFMRLRDEDFAAMVAALLPERYGEIEVLGGRAAYPLGYVHAASYIAPRMALIADAAHGIHPVAGQGLNLGFRDVKALADLLVQAREQGEDPGSTEILEQYQRQRRFYNTAMAAATDTLVRLFSTSSPSVRFLRRTGLKIVANMPKARRFFIRQAMGDR